MNSDRVVVQSLLGEGPATRPVLAQRTGLSKPTVSEAIRRLTDQGVVVSLGPRHGALGRTPEEFGVDPDAGRVVGIDVGGSYLRVMAADVLGRPVASAQRRTPAGGWHGVVRELEAMLEELRAGDRAVPHLGIGVSTTGVVAPGTHTVSYAYAIDHDGEYDLLGTLRHRWDVPIHLENNVNCAALGEHWRGVAEGAGTVAFVYVGAGVGLGLLHEGRIFRGAHGAAGEIAYLPVGTTRHEGPRRQLEDVASADGILVGAASLWGSSRAPRTVEEVFDRATAREPLAEEVIASLASLVGDAVASVCAVIDPELVVLGGGVGSHPRLLGPVRSAVGNLLPYPPRIERTGLGPEASVHGAVALALRSAQARLVNRVSGVIGSLEEHPSTTDAVYPSSP